MQETDISKYKSDFKVPSSHFRRAYRHRYTIIAIVLVLLPLILWQIAELARYYAVSSIKERSQHTLNLVTANLRGELERFLPIPKLLANNPIYINFLAQTPTALSTDDINQSLERINVMVGSLDIYILDKTGLTLAASNWNTKRSFVGKNYSFRPYFQQSIQGRLGRYFALGSVSNERGYYFGYPVSHNNEIIGTVIVKLQVGQFEADWRAKDHEIIVTDEYGVIFLSSHPHWQYRTLTKLSSSQLKEVLESRKYSGKYGRKDISQLDMRVEPRKTEHGSFIQVKHRITKRKISNEIVTEPEQLITYLMNSKQMKEAGWKVSILARTDQVSSHVTAIVLVTAFLLISLTFIVAYVFERRRRIVEREYLQEQARRTLEWRVKERTQDLAQTNVKLRNEISERVRTEVELRKTQKGLIQAGRLAALGTLSAGISHELNQPLTAIRSYADNVQVYIKQQETDMVFSNLKSITELVDRMARIVKNLKTYASQNTKDLRSISIKQALQDALSLLERQLKSQNITIKQNWPDQDIEVIGGHVRLQQVFVNLITNAMDAMEQSETTELYINIENKEEHIHVTIRDTGTGISHEDASHVFDPFFTTKDVGKGLGLGLSITYGIIRQFGGAIEIANHPEGGVIATLKLIPAYKYMKNKEVV